MLFSWRGMTVMRVVALLLSGSAACRRRAAARVLEIRESTPDVFVEEIENVASALENGIGVACARDFVVLIGHPQRLHLVHPRKDSAYRNRFVIRAVENNDRYADGSLQFRRLMRPRNSRRGCANGCPEVGMLDAKVQPARPIDWPMMSMRVSSTADCGGSPAKIPRRR